MKKVFYLSGLVMAFLIITVSCEKSEFPIDSQQSKNPLPANAKKNQITELGVQSNECVTIKSGLLVASDGSLIETGFDEWGYNYQAQMFKGGYCDSYRDAAWCQEYKEVRLIMKWNDAWLSNKDCDGDGLLDRHYGHDSYIGSGAWITNHQSGEYVGEDGKVCKWNYFVKIIAVPADATLTSGVWYNADGTEIGPAIWGQFATIQEVYSDSGTGEHGISYKSPDHSGFGGW